ncbi:MAG TPA: transcriptional regulator, partial [Citreicella sp.]|nr:transcriptional regulator [Citreicella sp.]
ALSIAAIESRMAEPRRSDLVAKLRAAAQAVETPLAQLYAARTRI